MRVGGCLRVVLHATIEGCLCFSGGCVCPVVYVCCGELLVVDDRGILVVEGLRVFAFASTCNDLRMREAFWWLRVCGCLRLLRHATTDGVLFPSGRRGTAVGCVVFAMQLLPVASLHL